MFAALNLLIFAALLGLLFALRRWDWSLARRTLAGLVVGAGFGLAMQTLYGSEHTAVSETLTWTSVVGTTYVNLLRMIIMPLVLVMMFAAVVRMRDVAALGRIGGSVVGLLVTTTVIAAAIGVMVTSLFGLSADAVVQGARELERAQVLEDRYATIADLGLADMLVRFVPQNIFLDLTGARDTSVVAVVIFGVLSGIAALGVMAEFPRRADSIVESTETVRLIIMQLVRMVMELAPYGIAALIAGVVAGSSVADIANLLLFIVASYVAIALMFAVHALMLMLLGGISVAGYFQKVWPVLTFAFASRSSAATIPLSVETQVNALRVPAPVANIAASFGATVGQNGCAGIYPAMLATMIAPSMGIDPLAPTFLAGMLLIVAISSFGVAGVGGGATFAALIVLPALGFPVTVAAVLISVEPLIDMARTALNVNGSITAGVLTARWFPGGPLEDGSRFLGSVAKS